MPVIEIAEKNNNRRILPRYLNASYSDYFIDAIKEDIFSPDGQGDIMRMYDSLVIPDLRYKRVAAEIETSRPIDAIDVFDDLGFFYTKIDENKFLVFADSHAKDKYVLIQEGLKRGWLLEKTKKYEKQNFITDLQLMKGNPECCAKTYASYIDDIKIGIEEGHPFYKACIERIIKMVGRTAINGKDIRKMIEAGKIYPIEFIGRDHDLLPHEINCENALEACGEYAVSLEILEMDIKRRIGKKAEIINSIKEKRILEDSNKLAKILAKRN